MDVGAVSAVYGALISSVSIVIVYHSFALQSWLQRVDALHELAVDLSLTVRTDDLARDVARARSKELGLRFPWVQVVILGMATSVLLGSAGVMAICIRDQVSIWASGAPVVLLLLIYCGSTIATSRQGHSRLRSVADYLGDERRTS